MRDKTRMLEWLALAAVFYLLSVAFKEDPQLSTGLWKAGHVTAGGFLGYWIDRQAYGRILGKVCGDRLLCRAIIVAGCIAGLAFGL